jgi:hypothetical protein
MTESFEWFRSQVPWLKNHKSAKKLIKESFHVSVECHDWKSLATDGMPREATRPFPMPVITQQDALGEHKEHTVWSPDSPSWFSLPPN